MFAYTRAFSGFAVKDTQKAREFYGEALGIETSEANGIVTLHLPGDRDTLIYAKPDHAPANYTILNFAVADIEKAVDELTAAGVSMARYDGFEQDDKGIFRGGGPLIAWFTDPSGNVLAVIETQ